MKTLIKKVYVCYSCSKWFEWGKDSSWYGSLKDIDNGDIKHFFCSNKCKNKHLKNESK